MLRRRYNVDDATERTMLRKGVLYRMTQRSKLRSLNNDFDDGFDEGLQV
jgi:hypothetical protein